MLISKIIYAFVSVSLMGGVLGVLLAYASKVLAVKKDEKIKRLEEALPGINCGACGFAGCANYAEAIAEGKADSSLCAPGASETLAKLAEILGIEASGTKEKMVAFVSCIGGSTKAKSAYDYDGIKDCNAVHMMYGGNKGCKSGCLGMGSCIKVCPSDAIHYDADGLVKVVDALCISCGKCVQVCPTKVMKMIPASADFAVACNSTDKGAEVKKYCTVGCIGCRICEKKAPEGGYRIENNLASIDYSVKGERQAGAAACPSKCIISK